MLKKEDPTYYSKGSEGKLTSSVKKAYTRFLKMRGNPKEIALGFALGLFVGFTPYMGFHIAIAIFLAAIFKWNKIAAALGVWISNPLTAPIVYSLTYYVGSKMCVYTGNFNQAEELSISGMLKILHKAPEVLWILTLGGVVIGLPLAVLGYYVSYSAITKYREEIKEKLTIETKKIKKKLKKKR